MKNSQNIKALTRGGFLARNIFLNLLGYGAPLIVAVFAIPLLVHHLGTDRFGILTLAWAVIGYLSLLDMGLGRALTKLVAEKLGSGREETIPSLIWTALFTVLSLSMVIAVMAVWLSPHLIKHVLNVPIVLQAETIKTFYLLSLSVPIVVVSVALRGILEAHQRFDIVNGIRIPLGIYSFLAPLVILPVTHNLFHIVSVLILGKFVGLCFQFFLCLRVVPLMKHAVRFKRSDAGVLFKFGSWMTVTNIISPLLVNIDRFFIGSIISITAVAYYATPSEVVIKMLLLSGALMSVLFPAFSTSFDTDPQRAVHLLQRGVLHLFVVLFPITLVLVTFAKEGLHLWLGPLFAENSTTVLQLIAIGVMILSLGQVPYGYIQGAGRPDLTAKLHLAELTVYLPVLFFFTKAFGINGVAFAWLLRVAVDTAGMYILAVGISGQALVNSKFAGAMGLLVACLFWLSFFISTLTIKAVFIILVLTLFWTMVWRSMLSGSEKSTITTFLRRGQERAP